MNSNQWIDPLSDSSVALAAHVWSIGKAEAWGRLDRAIIAEELSPNLPFIEFKEYVESQITCPVCRVATPINATNCPSCNVDLQIAHGQKNVGPKPKPPSPNPNEERVLWVGSGEGKSNLTWLWIILICAGVWGLYLFFPGQSETFLGGLAGFLVSVVVLYHTYLTGQIAPTFRAGCYIWLLFFASISFMISGIRELKTYPNQNIPISTPTHSVVQNANATLAARATPTPNCFLWSTITASMARQTVCVYGKVSSIRESPSLQASYIYFGTRDEFFFVIPATIFEDLEVNHCVYSNGKIQLNTYKTPYIQITELFTCN